MPRTAIKDLADFMRTGSMNLYLLSIINIIGADFKLRLAFIVTTIPRRAVIKRSQEALFVSKDQSLHGLVLAAKWYSTLCNPMDVTLKSFLCP